MARLRHDRRAEGTVLRTSRGLGRVGRKGMAISASSV